MLLAFMLEFFGGRPKTPTPLHRPFVKRFTLYYRTVVCPVLSVCNVGVCGQTVGCTKMKLGMQVGLGQGDFLLVEDLAPRGGEQPTQFSAHVYCGQTARWIKMPLGTEVRLGQATLC